MLARHQVADGGFTVGEIEVGLRDRDAMPAVMIDDNVTVFGRYWDNRGAIAYYATRPEANRAGSETRVFGMENLPGAGGESRGRSGGTLECGKGDSGRGRCSA
jgi:hypothetical protein